jgi:hypothetical protein
MTAPAPSVCPRCDSEGWLEYGLTVVPVLCPDCNCAVCGRRTAAIAGECGLCWDAAERYYERVSDR